MIYLDNNASTTLYPEAISAITDFLKHNANAGAVHERGRRAKELLEQARHSVAKLVKADPKDVLFTSGATEANNIVLLGGKEKKALVSSMEHPSILNVHPNTERMPVDREGIIDLDYLENELKNYKPGEVIISVMYSSHETGVLEPVKEVAMLAKKYGQRYHMDCVQGAGKTFIDMHDIGCDSTSIAAHKIGGAQGIGALVCNIEKLGISKLIRGGGQEGGWRAGTVNIAGAISFGIAAEKCMATMEEKAKRLNYLRDKMEREIVSKNQQIMVASAGSERLPGTSRLIFPNVLSDKQVMYLDLKGICVSAGAACSSGAAQNNRSLKAMGYGLECSQCSIRVGMGWDTTEQDIDEFIEKYNLMVKELS